MADWIARFAQPEHIWFAKRLSANDTGQTKGHQAGPYVPKDLLFSVLPTLRDEAVENPRIVLEARTDSHGDIRPVTAIWYNGRLFGKTRNEARVTGWGGHRSPLLDPRATGALAIFVFADGAVGAATALHIWLADGANNADDLLEDLIGPVEPGTHVIWQPGTPARIVGRARVASCQLAASQLPSAWLDAFPSASEIVRKSVDLRPLGRETADVRLLRRRDCEFEIFKAVEQALVGPRVSQGFNGLDDFLALAQTVLQRRKSRSGRSLELHAREIFIEEGLEEGVDFSHGGQTEGGKKPDFLFPASAAYHDPSWPADRLRMLGAKTTARDRWRQILNEADRIPVKHLLTLQEGVSVPQFAEMTAAGVKLVVPEPLLKAYPAAVRPELVSLRSFVAEVRGLRR
ncbi:MAG TPA: type II restriction endonuclease [Brevundimonas sp.]|uniref:type II restriction endonuclease n=1 Tax=Brevundimonas sp. TaxID=1871086 RepID=UPI002E0FAD96|nr:type II restriction endonuclease [Brevundimonas sp.]